MDRTLKLANDSEFKKKLKLELNIEKLSKNKKIILYAPTFRDFELDYDCITLPINKLKKLKNYIILIRLHPLVRKCIDENIFNNSNFVNVCDYPDASDLLSIADILITDYSSIFFQFGVLDKPIIFYPYDYDKYISERGGFYLNYKKDLPGILVYDEDNLYNTILNIDIIFKKYRRKLDKFNKKYNEYSDGFACKRFVDKLNSGYFDESGDNKK